MPDNTSKQKETKKPGRYLVRFWIFIFVVYAFIILFFFGIAAGWFGKMPSFAELENPRQNLASEVYSSDGVLLGTYFIENRSNVTYRDISPYLINALISIEDVRFEKHSGIDEKALLRVFYGVMTGNRKGGGSTLTQQLAKNLFPRGYLSTPQLIIRKFQEWVTAVKLEKYYSKEEIIAMYCNTVSFGHNTYGIKSAAATFFGKTPDSLNVQESALMAAVVNAPTWFSPIRHPDRAMKRRNLVLAKMSEYGYITEQQFDSISQLPLGVGNFSVQDHNRGLATYFREHLRGELKKWCKTHYKADGTPYNLYKDGLKIYTTINSKMQRYAEEAVREHLANDLQPKFFKHWEGYTYAPFAFDTDKPEKEVEKVMMQAVKRSERYRKMKKSGIDMDSIMKSFHTPV